jgi:hypothetical protein
MNMLIADKNIILLYAILFGLAGLPLAYYLFRKEKDYGLVEKIIFGYIIGIIFVPFLFLLELFIGIKFNEALVYINWIAVFLAGLILNFLDKEFKPLNFNFKIQKQNLEGIIVKLFLFFFMAALFFITYSVSPVPIMDLDPYYYLDGVRQVVYDGYNYADDKTAWYPYPISSHVGNPIWKYMLASWFKTYNKNVEYDPYNLVAVGSIYPPLIGALSVFLVFLFFRELYKNNKTALLVSGIFAFAPIMFVKFQGGDFQIEPYNIFAFVLLLYSLIYYLKRNLDIKSASILTIGFFSIILSSNLGFIITGILALFFALYGSARFIYKKDFEDKKIALLVGLFLLTYLIYLLYLIASKLTIAQAFGNIIKPIIVFLGGIGVYYFLSFLAKNYQQKLGDEQKRALVLISIILIGLVAFFVLYQIESIKDLINSYITQGGYTTPLVRTIAEQNPGPASYSDVLGFIAEDYGIYKREFDVYGKSYESYDINLISMNTLLAQLSNFRITLMYIISQFGHIFLFMYNTFGAFVNNLTQSNTYEYNPKNLSLFTSIVFFGLVFLIIKEIIEWKKRDFGIDSILFISLILVLLGSLAKQKFTMYVGLIGIIISGIFFENARIIINYFLERYKEKLKYPLIVSYSLIVALAILLKPDLLLVGIFYLAVGNIFILVFFEFLFEKKSLLTWLIIALIICAQFFGPYLFSLSFFGQDKEELNQLISNYGVAAYPLLINSFIPRIYDDIKIAKLMEKDCEQLEKDPICMAIKAIVNKNTTELNPVYYYNREMCLRSLIAQDPNLKVTIDKQIAYNYRCSMVSAYWLDIMYWISKNTPKDSRIISWWDYGHWINFFGQRNTVLRNEQASHEMIGKTAAAFLHKDIEFLKQTMREYGANYALIDIEIVGNGQNKYNISLGGKYGALNYLGCAWQNKTNVTYYPGDSDCEIEHLWEQVIIPFNTNNCTISEEKQINGVVGYRIKFEKGRRIATPTYCFVEEYSNGVREIKAYRLNETTKTGELKVQKAKWTGYYGQDGIYLTAFYTKYPEWKDENGNIVDGWDDRTTKYYDSNLYSGFFLDELDGFELVYNSPQIRLYKLKD